MNAERSMPCRPTAADIIDTSAQRLDMADDVSDDGSAARFSGRGRSDGAVVPRWCRAPPDMHMRYVEVGDHRRRVGFQAVKDFGDIVIEDPIDFGGVGFGFGSVHGGLVLDRARARGGGDRLGRNARNAGNELGGVVRVDLRHI